MRRTVEIVKCDLCAKEIDISKSKFVSTISYPVIFNTNQTDGYSCDPYISIQELDICEDCRQKVLRIQGTGAMGNNSYKLREGKTE